MQSEETQPRHPIIRGRVDSTPCLSLVGLLIALDVLPRLKSWDSGVKQR